MEKNLSKLRCDRVSECCKENTPYVGVFACLFCFILCFSGHKAADEIYTRMPDLYRAGQFFVRF